MLDQVESVERRNAHSHRCTDDNERHEERQVLHRQEDISTSGLRHRAGSCVKSSGGSVQGKWQSSEKIADTSRHGRRPASGVGGRRREMADGRRARYAPARQWYLSCRK